MSIFSKIRGAKKAADEHRKSQALKDAEIPKVPYKHVPTHAASDALHVGHGMSGDGLRDQIKAQYRRRSELGPIRSGSDLLTSHAVYRRQSSATSLGDMSIASMMSAPPMPALPPGVTTAQPPLKPIHPAKMNNFRHSSYHGPMRSRPPFGTSPSGTSLSKGKSPLSTMTNSINELPEESQQDESPVEAVEAVQSSKRSTKSVSSSSSEGGLEMRYSTPGQSMTEPSVPHTRATSVASRAESQMSPKTIQTDVQRMDEPSRAKSPLYLLPSPIPERVASPPTFDAQLEDVETTPTQSMHQSSPMQPVQPVRPVHTPIQRMSTPVSQTPAELPASEATTPKQSEEWSSPYSFQRPASASTPRKNGTNFSRPTVVQELNSPPRLELPTEEEGNYVGLDLGIPAELISVGQNSSYPELKPKSPTQEPHSQSQDQMVRDARQPRIYNQRPHSQQPLQQAPNHQTQQSSVSPMQSFSSPRLQPAKTRSSQPTNDIPFPTFSPRETSPLEHPAVRMPHSKQFSRRASHQQPMQTQQQDYFPSQQVMQDYPVNYAQQQLQEDLEYERQQAYQQLSQNDPSYQQAQFQGQYSPHQAYSRNQIPNPPPVPLASKPASSMKSPTIGPITYTRVVTPNMNRPPQQYQATSPTTSPMLSPTRSPAINPLRNYTPPVGTLDQRPMMVQKTTPIVTVLNPTPSPGPEIPPQQPAPVKGQRKEKEKKPRNILRKGGKRNSAAVKAF